MDFVEKTRGEVLRPLATGPRKTRALFRGEHNAIRFDHATVVKFHNHGSTDCFGLFEMIK
jgi:hypothetical protein